MSLIPADNVMALYAVLLGLACLGFWIDTLEIGRKISGVIWVLLAAMLLSNFSVIPFRSPSYDFIGSTLVPLAIPFWAACGMTGKKKSCTITPRT